MLPGEIYQLFEKRQFMKAKNQARVMPNIVKSILSLVTLEDHSKSCDTNPIIRKKLMILSFEKCASNIKDLALCYNIIMHHFDEDKVVNYFLSFFWNSMQKKELYSEFRQRIYAEKCQQGIVGMIKYRLR